MVEEGTAVGKEYEVCGKGEGGEGSSNGYSRAGGGGMRVGGVRRGAEESESQERERGSGWVRVC